MALPWQSSSTGLHEGGFRREVDFILYLMSRGDLEESLFLIERLKASDPVRADSLNYLEGWVLYRQQRLMASAMRLLNVSESSPVYHKSRLFGAYNLAHSGNTVRAASELTSVRVNKGSMPAAMKNLQMGGVALLRRDLDTYLLHQEEFSGGFHVMALEERRMHQHYETIRDNPPRSPFIGGLLSAAVPGLGRVYAGKAPEGIVSFLYVAALGALSYDIYRGKGPGHPLFIVSASATGIFYLGNIAGGAAAVRRMNNEFRYEIDQRILFDMHIPLRNAFN